MKISIIEPNSAGHHYTYVRHIAAAAARIGVDFQIHCTPAGRSTPEFKNHLGHIAEEHIDASLNPTGNGRLKMYGEINQTIRQVTKTARPDVIVYPTADFAAVAAGIGRITGRNSLQAKHSFCLMTKLGFSYPGVERKLFEWIDQAGLYLSSWDSIGIVDVVAYERLRRRNHSIANRLQLVPDPIFIPPKEADQMQCRAELGWELDRHIFVCLGVLRYGKGIIELLAGFLRLPSSAKVSLIFAGPVRDRIRPAFETAEVQAEIERGRIIVLDGMLDENQFSQMFRAADVSCCVYPSQNHPSSIALKSVAYDRPILYSQSLWLGEIAPRFEMGFPCDAKDPDSVATAMLESIEKKSSWKRSPQTDRLLEFQSVENFILHWEDTFRMIEDPNCARSAIQWSYVEPSGI